MPPAVPPASALAAPAAGIDWSGARLAPILAGGAGALALIALGLAGRADLPAAGVSAALVAGLGLFLGRRPPRSAAAAGEPAAAPSPDRTGSSLDPSFAEAVEGLPDPFMLVSAQEPDDFAMRRLSYANAAACELLRIPRQGALLVTALRNPEVLEAVDESLFGGVARTADFDGGGAQDRTWKVWTAPLAPLPDGTRQAMLLLHDETEARRAERMRADFLANASHELRTPLASLSGFIETLGGHARDDADARDRFLAIMARQADRMARLIDDLLSLSRIEMSEHVPPAGDFDLALAVTDTADAMAPAIAEAGVRLELILPPRRAAVAAGERDQIVQVIQNLLDNALKYSVPGGAVTLEARAGLTLEAAQAAIAQGAPGEGGGRFSLLTPDHAPETRYVLVQVTDHGPGMAREHLPRLAERFYRVEGQKSGRRPGTGLGLAIVKHIVNRHRGGLTVESAPGRGSRFSVYLPLAPAAVEAPAPASPTPGRPALVGATKLS